MWRVTVIWGDFQGISGVTRGGKGLNNWKIGVTSFMNDSLFQNTTGQIKPHTVTENEC